MERFYPPFPDSPERKATENRRGIEELRRRNPPTALGGGIPWPIEQEIPLSIGSRANTGFNYLDVSPPVGGYTLNNESGYLVNAGASSSRVAAIGDYFVVVSRIGPKGTSWWWNLGLLTGPDMGQLKIAVANLGEHADGGTDDPTALSYIDFNRAGGDTLDLYEPAPGFRWVTSTFAMTITGDDGAIATTITSPGGPYSFNIDGGAGLYAFKFHVVGKAAASSGYKIALAAMSLSRADAFDGWAL